MNGDSSQSASQPHSPKPRNGGADVLSSQTGLFRSWLRATLRGKPESGWRDTIEELLEENGEGDPTAADHERILLANIVRLRTLTAADVMVPRADISAQDVSTPVTDFIAAVAKRPHSRIPVFRETLDDVVGFVHIKDVLAHLANGSDFPLADLVRDVPIIAPSMPVLDLLLEMRQNRQHLALVVDEFGGIDGLVTIEDMVEEIVGEIDDEHDVEPEPEIAAEGDESWIADARVTIEDFEEVVGPVLAEEEREEIDTLGGLVFALAGRIPARGELIEHDSGLEFEVLEADPRRIRRLRVRRRPVADAAADHASHGK
jgi:CBS domain containing-hemolysin-like protein